VILSDYYDLPFNDIVNWRKFSIILREEDVGNLKTVLQSISDEQYKALHRSLRRVSVIKCVLG
jgi:ACT domain-containing protein